MTTSLSSAQVTRARVVVVVLVIAALIGGVLWWRDHQADARKQACTDMYSYSMYLDGQGYRGEIRDPQYLKDRDRCFG